MAPQRKFCVSIILPSHASLLQTTLEMLRTLSYQSTRGIYRLLPQWFVLLILSSLWANGYLLHLHMRTIQSLSVLHSLTQRSCHHIIILTNSTEQKEMWLQVSAVAAAGVITPFGLFCIYKELTHSEHGHGKNYSHMRIRRKGFPWDESDCTLFDLHCKHDWHDSHAHGGKSGGSHH